MAKKILCVFAHPDDESFFLGGTLAKYSKEKWIIHAICATNGEAGHSDIPSDSSVQNLGAIRRSELQEAATVLGIQEITFLDLKDGGLSTCTPGTLEDPIVQKMEAFLPDVVITFDPTGISNHPDHVKISYATTFAFQKYTKYLHSLVAKTVIGRGKEWKDQEYLRAFGDIEKTLDDPKLYYACVPEEIISYMIAKKLHEREAYGKPLKGTPEKMVTTVIDIRPYQLVKGKALLCHKSQEKDVDKYISFEGNPLVDKEFFVLRMHGIYEVFMGKNDRIAGEL